MPILLKLILWVITSSIAATMAFIVITATIQTFKAKPEHLSDDQYITWPSIKRSFAKTFKGWSY